MIKPNDEQLQLIRLFYNTDGRRGLYDTKTDETFVVIKSNNDVVFKGNLEGNATTATRSIGWLEESSNITYKIHVGTSASSNTNTISFITES